MLNRGIVEAIEDEMLIVRVPMYDKTSSAVGQNTPTVRCPFIGLPGIVPKYRVGDVVFIGHEGTIPVVLGTIGMKGSSSTSDIKVESIEVMTNANLPTDTQIGNITKDDLQNTKGVPQNLNGELQRLQNEIDKKDIKINQLENMLNTLMEEVNNIKNQLQ